MGKQLPVDPKPGRARFSKLSARLGALLHHIAQLPGQDQPSPAGTAAGLDEQDIPAYRRPGEPGGNAGYRSMLRHVRIEAARPQDSGNRVHVDKHLAGRALRHPHGDVAEDRPDLPLQVSHPRLPRVPVDDQVQRGIVERHRFGRQTVLPKLPRDQVTAGNRHFFLGRVAG